MKKQRPTFVIKYYEAPYNSKDKRSLITTIESYAPIFDADTVAKIADKNYDLLMDDWHGSEIDYEVSFIVNNSCMGWEE